MPARRLLLLFLSSVAATHIAAFLQVTVFITALLLIAATLTGAAWSYTNSQQTLNRLPSRRLARQAEQELEYTRFAALSHLTPLDERELAERHFWTPPAEVARIRGGQPYNRPWTYSDYRGAPAPITMRLELQRRAEKARAEFYGENRDGY